METIIGREEEIAELIRLYNSGKSEFVAVYGRRRIGKTFLVNQTLKGKITFKHTGISPIDSVENRSMLRTQLNAFYFSLLTYGFEGTSAPKSWFEAFYFLKQYLQQCDDGSRQVILFDELPWMDTPKSGFLPAFENFWNGWCNARDNIMLVICASATSWILGNVSRNKGGLYNRLTDEIKLSPFTLKECEQYLIANDITMNRYDIVRLYMVFGGVPYYLNFLMKGLSFEQNVDRLLFGNKPKFKEEFRRLFGTIFSDPETCINIVRFLSTRHYGYTRDEICKGVGVHSGSGISNNLSALVESDFVFKYVPFGLPNNKQHYKLSDNFCLFWLKHVEKRLHDASFMVDNTSSEIMSAWKGIAFEEVCWNHVEQIKQSLRIQGVKSSFSAWNVRENESGSQIDLIIDRSDNVVNLCELKFAGEEYTIDADEDMKLRKRVDSLRQILSPRKTIHLTMVTTYGVSKGKYSGSVQRSVTMDDLFV